MGKTIKPFEKAGGHTTFDNDILDHIMPNCKPNTWKVICATLRKTIGWQKDFDKISLSQYQLLTGISSRGTLLDAINDALENKFIEREKAGNTFLYRLNRDYEIEIGTETVPVRFSDRNRYDFQTEIGTETVHTKEKRKKKEETFFPIPDLLASSPEFIDAWNEFVEHRKQMKKKITPLAAARLFAKLTTFPIPVIIQALNMSVERGWLGVFPESIKPDQNGHDRKMTQTENGMYL